MPGFIYLFGFLTILCHAKDPSVSVKDLPVGQDTSIVIKKGTQAKDCVEYEILDGKDEVAGEPDYDKTKARVSWKAACAEWKTTFRELNKQNQILAMNCNTPSMQKEESTYTYRSTASYKLKTKKRETQP